VKDPQRLLDGAASPWELQLLRAGSSERPSDTSFRTAMAAAGVGMGLGLAARVAAAGAVDRLGAFARLGGLKSWLIRAVVSCSILGGGAANFHRGAAESTLASSSSNSPVPVESAKPPSVVRATLELAAKGSSLPLRPSPNAPTRVQGANHSLGILGQIELIDRARSAAASGDPSLVLGVVDEYDHRYPSGVLGQEATLLRIEALTARGDRPAASRLMRSFLARHPHSLLAPRVHALLGD